ncbi:MAG: FAD-dependent oxidoreductase, partial [Emcibacter sp.]|nr:FAD-dependent oxidoreductase [Emcibacter sp.]
MTNQARKAVCAKVSATEFFDDLHKPLNGLMAIKEADHCIYCYDAPCIQACPTSIDIPTFIHQIRTGNVSGAAQTILSENIMGGTCARACPTEVLCEEACVHNGGDSKPVEIGLLQRYATDHLMAQSGPHPFSRAADSGRHIAVVGAGPAGLSFAHRAAMLGHKVSVYEAKSKLGGLNEYGLAAYKMVDDFAANEVAFLLGIGGIEIYYDKALGSSISLDDLQVKHDAVFIGIGLGDTNDLGLDGEDKPGISNAIDFIEQLRQTSDLSGIKLGNDIIIIGGGNTA